MWNTSETQRNVCNFLRIHLFSELMAFARSCVSYSITIPRHPSKLRRRTSYCPPRYTRVAGSSTFWGLYPQFTTSSLNTSILSAFALLIIYSSCAVVIPYHLLQYLALFLSLSFLLVNCVHSPHHYLVAQSNPTSIFLPYSQLPDNYLATNLVSSMLQSFFLGKLSRCISSSD